jgi:hypothetical protein
MEHIIATESAAIPVGVHHHWKLLLYLSEY